MTEIQALVHDVFGTVVDWRGAVTADGEALAARNGIGGVDWQQFADEWRGLFYAMLFWLLLAFPTGRLGSRLDRIYIVAFFVWVGVVRPFPSAAFFDPTVEGPFDVPENPLLVRADPDLNTTVDRWLSLVDLGFIVLMLGLGSWRFVTRDG